MDPCDVCCAVGYFVLLFLVQRHASLCKSGEKRESSTHIFAKKRIASTKLSPPAQGRTDEQRSHSASDEDGTF